MYDELVVKSPSHTTVYTPAVKRASSGSSDLSLNRERFDRSLSMSATDEDLSNKYLESDEANYNLIFVSDKKRRCHQISQT